MSHNSLPQRVFAVSGVQGLYETMPLWGACRIQWGYLEASGQGALIRLALGGLSHWFLMKMHPIAPPQGGPDLLAGNQQPHGGRGIQKLNWGKFLQWKQPVAFEVTALTSLLEGDNRKGRCTVLTCQSWGSNSLGHQSKASLEMRNEPEHQAI